MNNSIKLRVGEWVEVREREEILRTLDKNGQLEGMPFMPEMFAFIGRRFRVYKRAHKTCDTVNDYKNRKMKDAVHLEGVRCDGKWHGECDAECLIFWKTAWLRTDGNNTAPTGGSPPDLGACAAHDNTPLHCCEADVLSSTRKAGPEECDGPSYICQATQLPFATEPLPWWDLRQYYEDYTSGNVGLRRMAKGFSYMGYQHLINAGIGLGAPLRWLYDKIQSFRGGVPYPRWSGILPVDGSTPAIRLDLQPGEWARIKSYEGILATCDKNLKNRGMRFDAELVPYCEKTYRVLKRVNKIVNEKTGKIQELKTPAVILESVICQARYSECRLFCPRSLYPFWREIWLERASEASCNASEAK